ncbi:hypothetical protein SeLEV6574_g04531 [Synchytrium endobioticum]|uniref:Inositol polyphosphate-related phosphatase domain-containing protein n=1 Tax=Synchytrium endobioticum TaxID=286115 RepID=A0A507CZQ4_9FUNG|nr:hypothetical protein SeLEV6574_g04531 [Synchytrium endobioticum]
MPINQHQRLLGRRAPPSCQDRDSRISRFWSALLQLVWRSSSHRHTPSPPLLSKKKRKVQPSDSATSQPRDLRKRVAPSGEGAEPDFTPAGSPLKAGGHDVRADLATKVTPSLYIHTNRDAVRASTTSTLSSLHTNASISSSRRLLANSHTNRSRMNLSRSLNNMGAFLSKLSRSDLHEDSSIKRDKLRIHIGTWNMNGKLPFGHLNDFIPSDYHQHQHIFIIGSQECQHSIEKSLVFSSKEEWEARLKAAAGDHYVCVCTETLAAIHIAVFVYKPYLRCVAGIEAGHIATGFAQVVGNKGAAAIGLKLESMSLLFICSHFAAHQDGVLDRNNNFKRINAELRLSGLSNAITGKPPTERYDCVFWFGDLNYRIDVPRDVAVKQIAKHNFEALLNHDQLHHEMRENRAFQGFTEPEIHFPPTYKFEVFHKSKSNVTSPTSANFTWRLPHSQLQPKALPRLFSSGFSLPVHRVRVYDTSSKMYTSCMDVDGSDHVPVIADLVIDYDMSIRREGDDNHLHLLDFRGTHESMCLIH